MWGSPVDADGLAAALQRAPPGCAGSSCRGPAWRSSSTSSTTTGSGRAARASTPSRWPRWRSRWPWPACAASAPTPGPTAWEKPQGTNLLGARVTILGGGGITESLLRLLKPFDCHVTVVRNRAQDMDGADVVLESDLPHRLAARRRPRGRGPRPDAGHRGHHQRQRARADGAARLAGERGPRPPRRHRRPRHRPAGRRHRRGRSRRHRSRAAARRATRSGRCRTASSRPTSPTRPRWPSPCWPTRITENVRRFARGEELIGPVDPELGY